MISYKVAMKMKIYMILITVIYCTFSFYDVTYHYKLIMFGLLAYHLHLFWEEYTILNKGAEYNV